MGWGGPFMVDGREVGYSVEAECDLDGCGKRIDRGLGYICGTMHGDTDEWGCARYYCSAHLDSFTHDCQGIWQGCDHDYVEDPETPGECGRDEATWKLPDGSGVYCGYARSDHEWTER